MQGEDQQKLDVIANQIFINSLRSSGKVRVMVSEEDDNIIVVEDKRLQGNYCVVFDPLDGSSNIECGVSIGTIFGIYKTTVRFLVILATVHSLATEGNGLLAQQPAGLRRRCASTGQGDGGCRILHVRLQHQLCPCHLPRRQWVYSRYGTSYSFQAMPRKR